MFLALFRFVTAMLRAIVVSVYIFLSCLNPPNAISPDVVQKVRDSIPGDASVMVILDSCHTREHVLNELRQYCPLVSQNSYIVATDGIMKDVVGAPRTQDDWGENNPYRAIADFLQETEDFVQEEPEWLFNESEGLKGRVTYWPGAYLRRV